jgi:hypothetical protein
MSPISGLCVIATWFILGMTRIVVTSRLAEHRLDNPDPGAAMAINRDARVQRLNVANYDSEGCRLLPWYRVVNTSYWVVAAGACGWAILSR